jgi:hypothetical protein
MSMLDGSVLGLASGVVRTRWGGHEHIDAEVLNRLISIGG